ncbi:hypothetical protein L484_008965 [Morus notabilis]|uniref:Uncharacterized protein n=1 Tax=Morus notabilis TaxID=981085 RepID=W9SL57_9ROSA|nr:hypothetical protein L484_008965 [Morus notabilis]
MDSQVKREKSKEPLGADVTRTGGVLLLVEVTDAIRGTFLLANVKMHGRANEARHSGFANLKGPNRLLMMRAWKEY